MKYFEVKILLFFFQMIYLNLEQVLLNEEGVVSFKAYLSSKEEGVLQWKNFDGNLSSVLPYLILI